jgi:hypothetical protein
MWYRFFFAREGVEGGERTKARTPCTKGIITETGRFLR